MVNKELKKLNRRELVDLIYQMKKNEDEMQERIIALEKALEERRIHLSKAGSIAEAAMQLTDVFSAAQSTADLYLREIAFMKEEAQKECDKMIEDAKKKVEEIMADGKKQHDALAERYQILYNKRQLLRDEIKKLEKHKSNK